jgi:hypothetical protein
VKFHLLPPLLLLGSMATAAAEDTNAQYLSRLFGQACLANLGRPEATRQWAVDHRLTPVTDPAAFAVFAGPGTKPPEAPPAAETPGPAPGPAAVQPAAWFVPGPGKQAFVLSLRGAIGACAVWAQAADPEGVTNAFLNGVRDPEKPDIEVRDVGQRVSTTPFGKLTIIFYAIEAAARRGFLFTVITSERPGGAFQASLQVAPVAAPWSPESKKRNTDAPRH